jgi:hypothetical protein
MGNRSPSFLRNITCGMYHRGGTVMPQFLLPNVLLGPGDMIIPLRPIPVPSSQDATITQLFCMICGKTITLSSPLSLGDQPRPVGLIKEVEEHYDQF